MKKATPEIIQHLRDLTPDPHNARRHNPRNVGMLEKALNEVGAARSIVIDEDGVVLAGNATIEAAQQAGIERVRVIEADGNEIIAVQRKGLSPDQKTKLALYDNRVAELAEWEPGVLAELAGEIDLSGMYFPHELNAILEGAADTLLLPDPAPQKEPELKSEAFIEIYCSANDLDEFRSTLDQWSARKNVTVNIS